MRASVESPVEIPAVTLASAGSALSSRPYVRRGVTTSDRMLRVLLVDDHVVMRHAIRLMLQRSAPDVNVVGEASSGHEAVAAAMRLMPDIVIMDLDMPDGDGEEATRALHQALPATRVLILTMHEEEERLLRLLRAGARGYLVKDAEDHELLDAIRVVAAGDVFVRPAVARRLAAITGEANAAAPANPHLTQFERLSDREKTVLRLVAVGYNGPEIGRQLGITAKTVDTYKQRIEEKLGISHRTGYVRFALMAGLLKA
ncbi:MAG: response regulator transcription factor [Gemmatimonadaceae bacterium]